MAVIGSVGNAGGEAIDMMGGRGGGYDEGVSRSGVARRSCGCVIAGRTSAVLVPLVAC